MKYYERVVATYSVGERVRLQQYSMDELFYGKGYYNKTFERFGATTGVVTHVPSGQQKLVGVRQQKLVGVRFEFGGLSGAFYQTVLSCDLQHENSV